MKLYMLFHKNEIMQQLSFIFDEIEQLSLFHTNQAPFEVIVFIWSCFTG